MVTLANLQGSDLVVDPVPAIQAIGQGVGDVLVNQAQEQVFSETTSPSQKRDAFLRISKINPQFGQVVLGLLEKQESVKLRQIQEKTDEQARFAALLLQQGNHDKRVKLLQDKASEAVVGGEDPSELLRMADLDEDQLKINMQEAILQARDLKTIVSPNVQDIDPTKFTPESVQAFSQNQDFSALVPIGGPGGESRFGKPSIKDFTSKSVEKFRKSGNEGDLVLRGDLQSPEGKQFSDQQLVDNQSGADSIEAQALRAAFKASKEPAISPSDITGIERDLRNQFAQRSVKFVTAKAALKKVLTSEQTPIGDLAKTVAFMKTIDPDSAVLQGEQATAQSAGSVPDKLINLYNKLLGTGEMLTPTQRANMDNQALKNFNALVPAQRQLQKFFTDTSKRSGADSKNVVLDLIDTRAQGAPTPAPKAGPAGGAPTIAAGATPTTALDDLNEFTIGKFKVKVKN